MTAYKNKAFLYFTFPLAILVAIGAVIGIFMKETYINETENWRIQGIGQDIVDLFIVVPALVISGVSAYLNNKIAYFIFGGSILFLIYSYAIYCFAVHFNYLFLIYCFTFGLSVYSFAWFIVSQSAEAVRNWFDNNVPVKLLGSILIIIAVVFYFLWLSDIIPAIITHKAPKSLVGTGMLTNPVHVLDISLLLPGMIITSIFLIKGKPVGYLLAAILLVFCLLMDVNIFVLTIFMKIKGVGDGLSAAYFMGTLIVVSLILLYILFKHLKKKNVQI